MNFIILLVEDSFQAELKCEKEPKCAFELKLIKLLETWNEELGWIAADTSLILRESPVWIELENRAQQKYYEDEAEKVSN
jgi:hypothetical protein